MAVLVIGGSGFVGLNIVEQLLREGETVTLFDAEPAPSSALAVMDALAGQLRVVIGDVCEAGAIANAITTDVQTMVYGAAITAGFERDRDNPEATFAVNLHGFMAALRAARDAGVRRVINLSSAGAYGAAAFHGSGPLYEDLPAPDPKSIYSITKFASE
ncbi:MAG: NAD(P)-dependent oxidoreductase, partial [Paracoccaceae bacterium]|nr:NAD(P)-dependent oxidoreductase [Paracoccaceae bacterium]